MADNAKASGRKSGMAVDTALVRELAQMLSDTGLTEIEVEDGERRIRVSRGAVAAAAAEYAPAAPAPAPASAPAPAPAEPAATPEAPAGTPVKSPMVGTAYLSPEPGAPPLIKVGDTVKAGDTLLIVEAMKVMNPITAPESGTITAILIDNAQPIEFDQPLMIVD